MANGKKIRRVEKRIRAEIHAAADQGMSVDYRTGLNDALMIVREIRGTCSMAYHRG